MIRWAVSRPAVIWAASVAVTLGGAVSFTRLALATKTTVELPRLTVNAAYPGAAAELVEMYVTSPIEAAVQGVRGVRRTSSESREGSSSITATLDPKANVQMTRLAILERIELLRTEFPVGVSQPSVTNFVPQELEEEPLLRVVLSGPYTPGALQRLSDEEIVPRVAAVPGVAGVSVGGGAALGATVVYDGTLMRQLGIQPASLTDAVRGARQVASLGIERFGASKREVVLRDQPSALSDLEDLPVRGRGNRVFRLGEIAEVRPEEDTRGAFYRVNGNTAMGLTISRLPGADAIKTAKAVRRALVGMADELPPGVRWQVSADSSIDLAESLDDLLRRGAIAFAAVALVLALALRNTRAVLLVMGSAAIAIAGTALGLYLLEIPANMLTLAGLGMGIGVLVQNGLVVVERLRGTPDTPAGRAEVARRMVPAIMGSTLTTAVVLFPFLYLQGNARAAFFPFAAAFTLALACSVVSALVMIPALAGGHGLKETHWPRAQQAYGWFVKKTIRWRWVTLVLALGMVGGLSWVFVKKVPRFSFGSFGGDRTTIGVSIGFPRGSDPETLDAAMREMEEIVVGRAGVSEVVSSGSGTRAYMRVSFHRDAELTAIPLQLQEALTARAVFIGGASISVQGQGPGFYSGGGVGSMSTFRIRVLGYSYAAVQRLAEDLKQRLETITRVRNVMVTSGSFFSDGRSVAVTLDPDRDALARFGVTARDFSAAVRREIAGAENATRIEVGGEEIPISVKAKGARFRAFDELRAAIVPVPTDAPARIEDLSVVSELEQLGTITRDDQQYLRIVAYEFRGPSRLANRTHDAFMKSVSVPPGFTVEDQNYFQQNQDTSQRGLWLVFGLGVVLVILSVAMVFDSAWGAAMVFMSLPLALAGVMAAFWLADAAFTREAAVGVILVVGLAVNQAILLVDAALERRRRSRESRLTGADVLRSALDRSGMIVMVTLTTIASLIPLAVGTESSSLFGAIALATAGGTVAGTLGAMLIMPAMLAGRRRRA